MKSKFHFWLLITLFLTTAPMADAQQAGKLFRIGFPDTSNASGIAVLSEAFRQELTKLGWIEQKNIAGATRTFWIGGGHDVHYTS